MLEGDLAKGRAQKRISLKGRLIEEQISQIKALTAISSTTDIIKGVVLKINEELLTNKDEERLARLKAIAATVA